LTFAGLVVAGALVVVVGMVVVTVLVVAMVVSADRSIVASVAEGETAWSIAAPPPPGAVPAAANMAMQPVNRRAQVPKVAVMMNHACL
jgi:hypothetical protein